jgi:hypothetical protein
MTLTFSVAASFFFLLSKNLFLMLNEDSFLLPPTTHRASLARWRMCIRQAHSCTGAIARFGSLSGMSPRALARPLARLMLARPLASDFGARRVGVLGTGVTSAAPHAQSPLAKAMCMDPRPCAELCKAARTTSSSRRRHGPAEQPRRALQRLQAPLPARPMDGPDVPRSHLARRKVRARHHPGRARPLAGARQPGAPHLQREDPVLRPSS